MASVTFTIDDADYPEFRDAVLAVHPVPPDPETGDPIMTDNEWIKEWGRRVYWAAYKQGRKVLRDQAYPFTSDPDIIV